MRVDKADEQEWAHYDTLDIWGRPPDEANRERLARSHGLIPADTRSILDVGCGDGASTNALAQRDIFLAGVDPSPRAMRHAAAETAVALGDRLPFADASFDLVMALEVIEHLAEPVFGRVLDDMARVARRHILLSTPHQEALQRLTTRCDDCGAVFHRNLHHHSLSFEDHAALFEDRGFVHEHTEGILDWRPNPTWARLRHSIFGTYALAPTPHCPHCGSTSVWRRPPLPIRAVVRAADETAGLLTPPVPRWIVSRYRRIEEADTIGSGPKGAGTTDGA